MNKLDRDYQNLLKDILENGNKKMDRTGTGTLSIFGRIIRHKMSDGFPLLTTKKMYTKGIITELIWFLRGDTNIKYLVENDCHIWDGDAYKAYATSHIRKTREQQEKMRANGWESISLDPHYLSKEEFIEKIKTDADFAEKWGDLGPIYGKQWRKWGERRDDSIDNEYFVGIDQIANLIHDLKNNPDSRRLIVNAWNVGEIDNMVLPPCHYGFQCYTRELTEKERWNCLRELSIGHIIPWDRMGLPQHEWFDKYTTIYNTNIPISIPKRALTLMWEQRSVDTFLGLPFNIASYGLLLEILAKVCNMVPDELIGVLGDTHLYLNHIEQAKEQIGREMTNEERNEWFVKYLSDGKIKDNLSDLELEQAFVPRETREPYKLPSLVHMNTNAFYNSLSKDVSLFGHLKPDDFIFDNYKSHPTIKADLSN